MKRLLAIAALVGTLSSAATNMAAAQSDPFIGQVALFTYGGTSPWCPTGWAAASGQLMPIQQNAALFSLLGTTFGGDGRNNFGLPDLRGRAAIGAGTPPGLPTYVQGQPVGVPNVTITAANVNARGVFPSTTVGASGSTTLTVNNMPQHTHQLYGSSAGPGVNSPNGALSPTFAPAVHNYSATTAPADVSFSTKAIGNAGQATPAPVTISVVTTIPQTNVPVTVGAGTPLATQSPSLVLTWCIATQGIFPQRP